MRIALLGATGRTGTHLLAACLASGHDVPVLVRDPARLTPDLVDRIRLVVGDCADPAALADVAAGADVVVSALGPVGREPDLHTRTSRALIALLAANGPRRFVGISGAGLDVPSDRKSLRDKVISALIRTVGGAVVKDKAHEYALWAGSDLDWTLVRPPRLVDEAASREPLQHHAHESTPSTRLAREDLGRLPPQGRRGRALPAASPVRRLTPTMNPLTPIGVCAALPRSPVPPVTTRRHPKMNGGSGLRRTRRG